MLGGWNNGLLAGCESDTNVAHLLSPSWWIVWTVSSVVPQDMVGG